MTPRLAVMFVVALCVSLGAAARGHTQESPKQDAVASLLDEVRALRTTLEAVAAAGANGQLTLGRLQLQEERLNRSTTRLDASRRQLASLHQQSAHYLEEAADVEALLKEAPVHGALKRYGMEKEREAIELELKSIRSQVAAFAAEIQRVTAEEAMLAGEVAEEQTRWYELNRRLEEIEHNLARRIGSPGVR